MKKTRELIATHYRRSIKKSTSGNVQDVDLQNHCPICGACLSADLVKNSEPEQRPKSGHVCSSTRKDGANGSESRGTRNGSTPQKPESLGEG